MKIVLVLLLSLNFSLGFAQKTEKVSTKTVADKFESRSPQDPSVPPPPIMVFPAQFPGGNKKFVDLVKLNLSTEAKSPSSKIRKTEIILKIDASGNVLNISTFGEDEVFNKEVKEAARKSTENVKWEPAKNREGVKVIEVVRIPFHWKG